MTTVAVLDRETVSLDAGEHVSLPLEVTNVGDTVEDYHLEVVGIPAQWTTIDHSEFTLYPGTSTVATLDVHPPRSSEVPAGELRFGIRVVPVDHPDEAVVPEAVVEVLPYLETTAELVPHTSRGRLGATHQVAVDNRGNIPVTALLTLTDPGQLLRVSPTGPAMSVLPGQAVFADVRVDPAARLWRGTPRTIPFAVTVSPQDSSSVTLEGAHLQEPLVPPWLGKALLALLALLLLLAALWYWLLRPAVQSAAKEAAAESIGEPAKQASTSAQAAQAAGTEAQAAETEAATSAEQAAASAAQAKKVAGGPAAPKTITAPYSGRLRLESVPGTTDSTSYVVPAGQSLAVSDLVLENSQGDEGLMRVSVNDTDVLEQALESFRTTDYHFVTQFVAPEESRVTLTVVCRRAGAPPGVSPAPSTCANALTFGGPMTKPAPKQ
jgi:biotin carboxyl carrier protein